MLTRRYARVALCLVLAATGVLTTASPSSAATSHPSGKRIPASSKHWVRTFYDDFKGSTVSSKRWGRYQGKPRSAGSSSWIAKNAFVRKGVLTLRTNKVNGHWYAAGVSNARAGGQKYGRWLVRFRAADAPGVSYVFLLYPSNGGWPPEIDFAEDAGTHHRKQMMQTLHYGSHNSQIHKFTRSNFTAWHTVGVDWTSTTLTYTLDGKVISRVKHSGVPDEKMWLGMQTQVNHPTASTPKTVDVQIDWVARYRRR